MLTFIAAVYLAFLLHLGADRLADYLTQMEIKKGRM